MDQRIVDLFKTGRVNEARVLYGGDIPDNLIYADDAARKRFEAQNDFGPHRAFDNCGSNWKQYFFTHDALHNTHDDVVFSIFDRYKCDLRCPTCYLDGYWMGENQFAHFVPDTWTPDVEEMILEVFNHFYRVGSIDDLRLVKTKYPHLYGFFTRNAPLMEHNITDNGFFAQYDILMNECRFDHTAYLSFSDFILDKNDGGVVDRIIPMLERLHDRSPVRKMNFIMSQGYATENPNAMRLFEWVVKNTDIETFFHTDLCKPKDYVSDLKAQFGYDLPSIYYQENAYNPPIICQILTETIQLRRTSFYTTLTGSTVGPEADPRIALPFYDFNGGWDVGEFVAGLLRGKIETYDYYRSMMSITEGNRYWEYFSWCAYNLVVNDEYTFIPATMLRPWSNMFKKIEETGQFVNTYAGLLKKGAKSVIPIVSVKS